MMRLGSWSQSEVTRLDFRGRENIFRHTLQHVSPKVVPRSMSGSENYEGVPWWVISLKRLESTGHEFSFTFAKPLHAMVWLEECWRLGCGEDPGHHVHPGHPGHHGHHGHDNSGHPAALRWRLTNSCLPPVTEWWFLIFNPVRQKSAS